MKHEQMKPSRFFLKGDDRGASLIAVVIAVVFVLTIVTITLEITTTNIQLRYVESSEKENFYGADGAMEELTQAMADVAAEKMQEAYAEALSRYGVVAEEGTEVQDEFKQIYMNKLEENFMSIVESPLIDKDGYKVGTYDWDKVSKMLPKAKGTDGEEQHMEMETGKEPQFITDYENGLYTLKNLTVVYEDGDGYKTWITTDLVFETPLFPSGSTLLPFMEYALIADEKIWIRGDLPGRDVIGSAYAGPGGIETESGHCEGVTFLGNNVVTKGDIVVNSGTKLAIGKPNGTTDIWAQNIRTEGKGEDSFLEINGDINVADDLALNGRGSNVTLSGSYSGYNFHEDYGKDDDTFSGKSEFSSAIMINGKKSILDLSDINHLFLAGRTFISRRNDTNKKDIQMGESLSVRTNQIAYYVDDKYLKKAVGEDGKPVVDEHGKTVVDVNPETGTTTFADGGLEKYASDIGFDEETADKLKTDWLVGGREVISYHFNDSIGSDPVQETLFYLNFNSPAKASEFFDAYWKANSGKLGAYGKEYAEKIRVDFGGDSDKALTLGGNLLYWDEEEDILDLLSVELDEEKGWESGDVYWKRADLLDRTYNSLNIDLAGDYSKKYTPEQKEGSVFENLINEKKYKALFDGMVSDKGDGTIFIERHSHTGVWSDDYDGDPCLIIVYSSDGSFSYELPRCKKGLVITNGSAEIQSSIRGLVIAGGTITLEGNTESYDMEADANIVKEVLDANSDVAAIFNYRPATGAVDEDRVRMREYLTYENWMKNEAELQDRTRNNGDPEEPDGD